MRFLITVTQTGGGQKLYLHRARSVLEALEEAKSNFEDLATVAVGMDTLVGESTMAIWPEVIQEPLLRSAHTPGCGRVHFS
jgi:hypothetical protein